MRNKCNSCQHNIGLYGNVMCEHTQYCDKCIHRYSHLVDNFKQK